MMNWTRCTLTLICCYVTLIASGGELSKIRGDLHSQSGSSSNSSSSSSSNPPSKSDLGQPSRSDSGHTSRHCDDDDGDSLTSRLAALGLMGFGAAVTSPFWAPYLMLGDDLDRDGYFPKHPYENIDGTLTLDETVRGTHDTAITLQGVLGTDFGDMQLINGRALIEHRSRFGIDTEFKYRRENLAGGSHDHLWNGDANLTFRFAQHEHWLIRAGLGVNWLDNRGDTEAGFNLTYGVDWYPVDPLIVSGVIDWGRISAASLFHGRATIGFIREGWGAFTGYDYFRVSDSDAHSWIAGIERRF